jgi:quinolinate synthase
MSAAPFPSLTITRRALTPEGSFAEAQAAYLRPDPRTVGELEALVRAKNVGIVAHFYMDPELQGVLARLTWPEVHVSDSLLMADRAVAMAANGVRSVVVLGVDFMSENARAMLDAGGFQNVPVYRVAAEPIGCSLASSAETLAYSAFLHRASRTPKSVHVVYINTSLVTKARAHSLVPTITCTSSNVVQTVLAAFAQIPEGHVWFGPDTYMGQNLAHLLRSMAELTDDEIRAVHPAHDRASIRSALTRFHYFEQGNCIVHHMFGADVSRRVREEYADAFITAHLEVPGEMFSLALEARDRGRGVVGSTSDILTFIEKRVREAGAKEGPQRLRFVLGTEAGMITSIVRQVEAVLETIGRDDVAAEIVFPVASEAITAAPDSPLAIVPGPSGGEGCTTAGGCATCPYMKMNSLDALFSLLRRLDVEDDDQLAEFHPHVYAERVDGKTVAEVGGIPILHMRAFGKEKKLPKALVDDVLTRRPRETAPTV